MMKPDGREEEGSQGTKWDKQIALIESLTREQRCLIVQAGAMVWYVGWCAQQPSSLPAH